MNRTLSKSKPETKLIRCAIYTRKSTEEGLEQEFNSLDAQRESGEAFVASQHHEGWTCLQNRYDDGGFTGGNLDRPALKRLLADIEAGKIDCVVVYKVDRLSRSLLDFARLVEIFDKHQVSFVSVTQQFNTATSMGRLVLNVLLSFAQFEREIISERIRDKIAATKRKGKWSGGTPLLGYDVDRSQGRARLVINPREAAQVKDIFQLYLSLGALLPVVGELASRGWKNKEWQTKKGDSKGGRPFDKGSLYSLLTNPLFIGKIRHKAQWFPGEHDAIVEWDVFQKVQSTLRQHGRSLGGLVRNRHGALLKGLLFCKNCQRAMTHSFSCKGNKQYRYYICTRAIHNGYNSCPSGSLPAGEMERLVVDQIRGIGGISSLQEEVFRQAQEQFEYDLNEFLSEQRKLELELQQSHAEIRRVSTQGSSLEVSRFLVDINERISKAEMCLAEIRQQVEGHRAQQLSWKEIQKAFEDFDGIWKTRTPLEQSQLLALLIAKVEFDVTDHSIAISLYPAGIKELAKEKVEYDHD